MNMKDRFLELSHISKAFATPTGPAVIVKDFTIRIREGEFVCIIGHSGCGKSTVLSIVMGLQEPTEGGAILDGKELTGPGTDRGVVFQSPTLLPWLSARENVLLALDQVSTNLSGRERLQLADYYLEFVGLVDVANRYPEELSAGMRQRVGIARALALEPKVLLLDEPFSLLDALTRFELQDQLVQICERTNKTVIMVTHDVDEALFLADRIVMMTNGPAATIGGILQVPLPRPRIRSQALEHPAYYPARDQLLNFLESGTSPTPQKGLNDEETPRLLAASFR